LVPTSSTHKTIKEFHPDLRITVDMLTWWKIEDVPLFAAHALDADTLFASEWFFPKRGFKALAQEGIPVVVYLWGLQDLEKRFRQAVKLGASAVSCDDPLSLLPLVKPASPHGQ
jgi:glycerophosphoryl diester phosphodiesterase